MSSTPQLLRCLRYVHGAQFLKMHCSFTCVLGLRRTTALTTVRQYARGRTSSNQSSKENIFVQYLRSLRWVPIPLGVGFAYVGYQQFGHVVKREEKRLQSSQDPEDLLAGDWAVMLYRCLPLKIMSRVWGQLNNIELPVWLRSPLYKTYIWAFECNMEEAAVRDLQHYRCLADFFRRRLRPAVRPVDQENAVVCPADGRVLHFGKAEHGLLEQVKGVTYSLQLFLGPPTWPKTGLNADNKPTAFDKLVPKSEHYERSLKCNPNHSLYHCVIYLAPGDYHGFHSPVDWTVLFRRHFPGELFSVNPGVARLIRGLFNWNERAVYMGDWQQGFFAMALVGATNVGSIAVYHDRCLETNAPFKYPSGAFFDENFQQEDISGIPMKRGESFGEFNLGSTIVLVFEAPKDFEFKIETGQKIKMGQPLGHTCREKS